MNHSHIVAPRSARLQAVPWEAAIRSHLIPSTALIANEETPDGGGISPGWAFGPQEIT
jgi:hypothetical protein